MDGEISGVSTTQATIESTSKKTRTMTQKTYAISNYDIDFYNIFSSSKDFFPGTNPSAPLGPPVKNK